RRTRCRADLRATPDRRRASPRSARSASPRTLPKCKPGSGSNSGVLPRLVGGSHGGVGVAMPQSLRGVGGARGAVAVFLPVEVATVFAGARAKRVGKSLLREGPCAKCTRFQHNS